MHQSHLSNPAHGQRHRSGWWVLALAVALLGLLAAAAQADLRASGAGTLVVIEDVSHLGGGSFSGNVCYQVVRDRDGVTVSEGCFSIATTIAAPDDLDTSERYTIVIFLADANCVLLDDPRTATGASPFYVRVSCDAAYMTATASAGGAPQGDHDASATETPAVELTAWPPVYDPPTVVIIGGEAESTTGPLASPIPMSHPADV